MERSKAVSISMRTRILRIVHPAPTRHVGFSQPPGANDDQEDIAPGDRVLQDPAKIPTERNRIYILEYTIWSKLTLEPIVDATGNVLGVLAPVGDEHIHFHLKASPIQDR